MPLNKELQTELADNDALVVCAKHFGLVGDPTRMKICWLLCQHPELSVSDIAQVLGTSISVVSHSLRRLRAYGLVEPMRQRRQVFYRLSNAPFIKILKQGLGGL